MCVCVCEKEEIHTGWLIFNVGARAGKETWKERFARDTQGQELGNKNRMALRPAWNIVEQRGRRQRESMTV